MVGKPSPRGPVPDRLKPLFCDREELPASGELGATLTGAIAESRAVELSGLSVAEIRGRSFVAILKNRGRA